MSGNDDAVVIEVGKSLPFRELITRALLPSLLLIPLIHHIYPTISFHHDSFVRQIIILTFLSCKSYGFWQISLTIFCMSQWTVIWMLGVTVPECGGYIQILKKKIYTNIYLDIRSYQSLTQICSCQLFGYDHIRIFVCIKIFVQFYLDICLFVCINFQDKNTLGQCFWLISLDIKLCFWIFFWKQWWKMQFRL